ncbi:MAG: terminase small subunit [Oscillospiraceae bacterium]|nr:terminase small subunit [Oscillospiraceae bacterium]
MPPKKRELTARERNFCALYARTRNEREAAARAGYCSLPQLAGLRLLARKDIRRGISRFSGEDLIRTDVVSGYQRLAFGAGTDAFRLLFMAEAPSQELLEQMDLFNISEIKNKETGLEIKFYNRADALERLEALGGAAAENGPKAFYDAIERSLTKGE